MNDERQKPMLHVHEKKSFRIYKKFERNAVSPIIKFAITFEMT
jgi:hypothetical protein